MTTQHAQLNIVIGHPLVHTKSPVLHGLVYKEIGVDAVMLPFSSPDLKKLIAAIRTLSIKLTAVTMPFKQSGMSLVDKIDRAALLTEMGNLSDTIRMPLVLNMRCAIRHCKARMFLLSVRAERHWPQPMWSKRTAVD